jgi:hypothetical protein
MGLRRTKGSEKPAEGEQEWNGRRAQGGFSTERKRRLPTRPASLLRSGEDAIS